MEEKNQTNLYAKYKSLPQDVMRNPELIKSMRHYDYTVNISWSMAHLYSATKYLDSGNKSSKATGGCIWKKYMHPQFQKRIFFPELRSKHELDNWGKHI